MNNYYLAIPSRGRADWLRKKKNTTLRQTSFLTPEFWVRKDDDYQAYCHYMMEHHLRPADYMVHYDGEGILGAAQTYDMMIDHYINDGGPDRLIILDDDLAFSMHNPIPDAKPDYKLCNSMELSALFQQAANLVCPEMPILSFTPIMTRSHDHLISYCKPMMMAYVYYLPHFKKHPEHRFWVGEEIEARCDLNLTLKILTEGYLTSFMVTLFIPDNVNNPGGCSIYRDLEMEVKSVNYLKTHYPNCTRPRMKRGWVDNPDVIRPAVTIQWKKAFDHFKFREHFGVEANVWAKEHLVKYERVYADFVKGIRENYGHDADRN
jgi:hypothetical protein